ncbi:MAG: penicillin-binding protein 2 [bacterium]|nr:penicillin-binding protein 2 [bacterium]
MDAYQKTIQSRLMAFSFAVIVLFFVLSYRMVEIGVFQHGHYLALAESQQRFEKTEMASRGRILVHDSVSDPNSYYPLSFDVKSFSVWAVPNQIRDKQKTATDLASLLSLVESDIFNSINNTKLYVPPLKRGLTLDQANSISNKNISGIFVMPEYSRFYPEGTLASQLLGFVNADGIGNYGVEGHYNSELTGKEGNVVGEKDTLGRMISMLSQTNPQNGTSYVLTIDRSVQYFVEQKLAKAITDYQADSGTVVIMDVKTGGIVAMASQPSFDPNDYKAQANTDPAKFVNPAIANLYEPGSIFKPLIVSSALDSGVLKPEDEGVFDKSVNVDGYTIHTAENKAFGRENVAQILQHSDNVGMVWVGNHLGNDLEYKYISKFGFLDKTGIDLDGETAGRMPALKQWHNINRATIAFGQGVSVTPLQMVTAYTALANNGKYIYPHVVDKIIYSDGGEKKIEKQEGEQIVSQKTAETVREMLYSVVQSGRIIKSLTQGFRVGAKTGTAQIPKAGGGYEANESNLGIFIHSVIGMAPSNDPRFVMLVKLDKPKTAEFAERTSGPLFGEIASYLLNYHYRIPPTESIQ